MKQRGRKSAAAEVVAKIVPPAERERPGPPECLGDDAAVVWRRIVESMPADWWRPEYEDVLVQYCRHRVAADRAQRILDGLMQEPEQDIGLVKDASRLVQLETAAMLSCARSLRITAQSQTRPKRSQRPSAAVKKPWQA